jgi:hypothetical protein
MAVLAIAGVSILIILYQFFRTEGLRRELAAVRRQLSNFIGDVKNMKEVVENLAFEQQINLRKRITQIKQFGHPDTPLLKFSETLSDAIVNVSADCAKGHKNAAEAFKKHLAKATDISYEDFADFISEQDDTIKAEWHKKTVIGYFSVCRLLLDKLSNTESQETPL